MVDWGRHAEKRRQMILVKWAPLISFKINVKHQNPKLRLVSSYLLQPTSPALTSLHAEHLLEALPALSLHAQVMGGGLRVMMAAMTALQSWLVHHGYSRCWKTRYANDMPMIYQWLWLIGHVDVDPWSFNTPLSEIAVTVPPNIASSTIADHKLPEIGPVGCVSSLNFNTKPQWVRRIPSLC